MCIRDRVSCWQKWDLKQAYIHLNKALSIRATDDMYLTMANFLTVEGKLDLAMIYLDKALQLAPLSSVNLNYKGFLYYMLGEYDKALVYFKQSLDIQPELPFPVVYIGSCYLLSGKLQQGLDYFNNLPEDTTGYLAKLGGTTITHGMMGNTTAAEAGMSQLETYLDTPSAGNALNFLVLCHAQLNNLDQAMTWVNQGVKNNFTLLMLLPTEPLAKPLHELKSFKDLMAKLIGTTKEKKRKTAPKKSLFKEDEIVRYKHRLIQLMENDQLYLNPELSLRELAQYMNLPPNHMSQLLNVGFDKNFADFVNTYRLEDFKTRLHDENSHHLTLLAMAYDSGFNSKTVFNTFFKKKVGMTPKAYWNQLSR